jgi:alkylation response protein AidB-like acyl-CoA dehydrogenase
MSGTSHEELQMIRDAASRLVQETVRVGVPAERDMTSQAWSLAVESGWLALGFGEADGGLDGSDAALCALTEELGRGLLVGSYVLGELLPGWLVSGARSSAVRNGLVTSIVDGERSLALADAEAGWRGCAGNVGTQATRRGERWIVNGNKVGAWATPATRSWLLTARSEPADPESLMLILVPRGSAGLCESAGRTIDGGTATDLALKAVEVSEEQVLCSPHCDARTHRDACWDRAALLTAAECLGIMQALIARTVEYLAARKQFGQPLLKLQVLRHRLADMALARLRAEALVSHLTGPGAGAGHADRTRWIAATMAKALEGARFVAEQAVQLHGGMGVSEEVPVGRYLRRVLALEATFGSPDYHRGRFVTTRTG